jgi:hypothetical protein
MRVLVQGLVAAPGGSLTVLRDLVAAWPEEDELLVLCWRPAAAEALATTGREVRRIPARSTGEALLRLRPRLDGMLRTFAPDVVWSQAVSVVRRDGPPEAVHYRDVGSFVPIHRRSPRRVLKERIERRDLLRADLRVFNSGVVRDAVLARHPQVAGLPSAVVHNGLDLTALATVAGAPRPPGPPRLLLPQSDLHHKRNVLAADVLHAVRAADPALAGTTLEVAGAGAYAGLRARLATLGLVDAATFLGHVPRTRMARAYADADSVLITSSGESFCNPIVEAHAAGRPIVLPPLPIARELDGPLSAVASGHDAAALASATVAALRSPPPPDRVAAAATYAAGFTATEAAQRLRGLLSSLTSGTDGA